MYRRQDDFFLSAIFFDNFYYVIYQKLQTK